MWFIIYLYGLLCILGGCFMRIFEKESFYFELTDMSLRGYLMKE